MAFLVDNGFRVTSAVPADLKSIWTTSASLYLSPVYPGGFISSSWRYHGMTVYCQDDQSTYKLIGGIDDINWVKISSGSFCSSSSYALFAVTSSHYLITSSVLNTTTADFALLAGEAIHTNTASWANTAVSSSFSLSSNYSISASWVSNSLSSSYLLPGIYEITSSWSQESILAMYAISASWASSSLSASYLIGTSSWTNNSIVSNTSLYASQSQWSISASWASRSLSSSYLPNGIYQITSAYSTNSDLLDGYHASYFQPLLVDGNKYNITSSWSTQSISSSYALTASYALNGGNSGSGVTPGGSYNISASWASSSISSSYALTASYALNGAGGGISGVGSVNYIPKWISSNTLSSTSSVYDNGSEVGVGIIDVYNSKLTVKKDGHIGFTWNSSSGSLPTTYVALTYGSGTFVTLGYPSTDVYTSSNNGRNWGKSSTILSNNWSSLCYGSGTFVGVSSQGNIITSTDAVVWTTQSVPVNKPWTGVTYGNNIFVAVSSDYTTANQIITSTDAITWSTHSCINVSPPSYYGAYQKVIYDGQKFIAIAGGSGGYQKIIYSFDGINWAFSNDIPVWSPNLINIAYGNGKYVITADSAIDYVLTSTDVLTWITQSVPTSSRYVGITHGDGYFVASAYSSTDYPIIITSQDAVTWVTESTSNCYQKTSLRSITYGDDLNRYKTFVAVGDFISIYSPSPRNPIALYVDDDIVCESITASLQGTSSYAITASYALNSETIGNGMLTVITTNTVGGSSWSQKSISGDTVGYPFKSIVYHDGKYISLYGSTYFSSSNGTDWVQVSGSYIGVNINTWTYAQTGSTTGSGIYVIAGQGWTNQIATSNNLVTWNTITLPQTLSLNSICYGNGLFVALDDNRYSPLTSKDKQIWTSPDGITWTSRSHSFPNNKSFTDIIYGGGKFVATAQESNYSTDNNVMTSTDGITWTTRSVQNPSGYGISNVTYGNGTYVALQNYSYTVPTKQVLTSVDAITWVTQSSPVEVYYWNGITYGNGTFVAVCSYQTNQNQIMTSTDGISWSMRSNPTSGFPDNQWIDIFYGDADKVFIISGLHEFLYSSAITKNVGIYGTQIFYGTASYALNGNGGGISPGGSYNISASWASSSLSSSYSLTSSYSLNSAGGVTPGASYNISASWASSSLLANALRTSRLINDTGFDGSSNITIQAAQDWSPVLMTGITYGKDAFTFLRTSGAGGWDAKFYSKQGFTSSLYASCKPTSTNQTRILGLNSNPTATIVDYSDIDFGWYLASDASTAIVRNGSIVGSFGNYTTNSVFDLTYDGVSIKYWFNGNLVTSSLRAIGLPLYLDCFLNTVNSQGLTDVRFGNMPWIPTQGNAYNIGSITNKFNNGYFSGSITASYFVGTSSYSVSASWAPSVGGTSLGTGSTYPITSSWAEKSVSSSYSDNTLSASYCLSGSYFSYIYYNVTQSLTYVTSASWASSSLSASYIDAGNITTGKLPNARLNDTISLDTINATTFNGTLNGTVNGGLTGSVLGNLTGSITGTAKTASYIDAGNITTGVLSNVILPNTISVDTVNATTFNGQLNGGLTGSVLGTSSYATDSSQLGGIVSSNYQRSLQTGSYIPVTSSWAYTASYALNGNIGGSSLGTGSTYPFTSSWSEKATTAYTAAFNDGLINTSQVTFAGVTSSLFGTANNALTLNNHLDTYFEPALVTGNTYTITSSWAVSCSNAFSAAYADYANTAGVANSVNFNGGLTNTSQVTFGGVTSSLNGNIMVTQDLSSTNCYPVWVTGGDSLQPLHINSGKLSFNSANGGLTAAGGFTGSLKGNADTSTNSSQLGGIVASGYQIKLITGSYYPITSSWAEYAPTDTTFSQSVAGRIDAKQDILTNQLYVITSSYAISASYSAVTFVTQSTNIQSSASWASSSISASYTSTLNGKPDTYFQSVLGTGSTYPFTSSWSEKSTTSTTAGTANAVNIAGGTTNYLSKFSSGNLVNSQLYDNGTNVGLRTITPVTSIDIVGATVIQTSGVTSTMANFGSYTYGGLLVGAGDGNQSMGIAIGGTYRNYASSDYTNARLTFHSLGVDDSLQNTIGAEVGGLPDNTNYADTGMHLLFRTKPSGGSLTNKMIIQAGGNVGIATTTPSEKLEVVGNVKATLFIGNLTGSVWGTSSWSDKSTTAYTAAFNNGLTTTSQVTFLGVTGSLKGSSSYAYASTITENATFAGTATIALNSNRATVATSALFSSQSVNSTNSTNSINSTNSTNAVYANTASYINAAGITTGYLPEERLWSATVYSTTCSWAVDSFRAGLASNSQLFLSKSLSYFQPALGTGSYYPITSSWAYTASYAINGGSGGNSLGTGSTYPFTSSWSNNSTTATSATNADTVDNVHIASLTNNYVTKYTTAGTQIVSGILYDNGSSVAIGTVNPTGALHVIGNITTDGVTNGSTTYLWLKNNSTPIGIFGSDGAIYGGTATNVGLYVYGSNQFDLSTNNNKRLSITSAGDVGINNSSPASRLHTVPDEGDSSNYVAGIRVSRAPSVLASNTSYVALNFANGAANLVSRGDASNYGYIQFVQYNGTSFRTAFSIDDTGTVRGFTGSIYGNATSATNSDTVDNVHIGSVSNNYVTKYSSTGTQIVNSILYDNGSSVGINTTFPTGALDVVGGVRATMGFTGSLQGTADNSNAVNFNNGLTTTSQVSFTGVTASFKGNLNGNASTATTAITATTANTVSFNDGLTTVSQVSFAGVTASFKGSLNGTATNADTVDSVHIGSLTNNYVTRYATAGTQLISGILYDNGSSVGIGTSSPTGALHVVGDMMVTGVVSVGGSGTTINIAGLFQTSNPYVISNTSVNALTIACTNNLTSPLSIDFNGNVGVGVSLPTKKLDVRGDVRMDVTTYASGAYALQGFADITIGTTLYKIPIYS